jgi:hypothetical protein
LGGTPAEFAPWHNLTLGRSVNVYPGDVVPACFPDILGQVWLRGVANVDPVPARGGNLVAIFPFTDEDMTCGCTPEENEVILTSTAIAYQTPGDPNVPDVCIVGLLVARTVCAGLIRDMVINETDINDILNSPFFSSNPVSTPNCPLLPDGRRDCGNTDVNRDGKVNILDVTSVQQSAPSGTAVPCGGVYASELSCGSTRAAPLTPAIRISLQGIYLNDDGVLAGVKKPLPHQYADDILSKKRQSTEYMDDILVEFDQLHSETNALKEDLEKALLKNEEQDKANAELLATTRELRSKMEEHHGATKHQGRRLVLDIVISAGAVLACAGLAFLIQKRR